MSWLHDNHLAFSHTPFLFFCHDQQLITIRMHGHQTYHFNFCFDLMNLKQTCDPSIMRLLFPDVLPHVYLWLKWLIPVIIAINKGHLIRGRVINDLACEKKNKCPWLACLTVTTFHMKINDMYSSSSFRSWMPLPGIHFCINLDLELLWICMLYFFIFLFFMPKMKAFAQAKSHF